MLYNPAETFRKIIELSVFLSVKLLVVIILLCMMLWPAVIQIIYIYLYQCMYIII